MEAIIERTVLPMVEGRVRRRVALIVAKVVGVHVERQLTDLLTTPSQLALGVDLIDLTGSVQER